MRRAGIVCRAHAEAYPDAYRCRYSIEECAKRGYIAVFMRELEIREPGADTKSFERLCVVQCIDQPSSLCGRGILRRYIRWKIMTMKSTLKFSSTAKVSPIRTLHGAGQRRGISADTQCKIHAYAR